MVLSGRTGCFLDDNSNVFDSKSSSWAVFGCFRDARFARDGFERGFVTGGTFAGRTGEDGGDLRGQLVYIRSEATDRLKIISPNQDRFSKMVRNGVKHRDFSVFAAGT